MDYEHNKHADNVVNNENDISIVYPKEELSLKSEDQKFQPHDQVQNQKRAASTPLTPLHNKSNQSRRRLEEINSEPEYLIIEAMNKNELIDMHCERWMMEQSLERQRKVIDFLEMERKYSLEDK